MPEDLVKPTFEEYGDWLQTTLHMALNEPAEQFYQNTARTLASAFEQSAFWQEFKKRLKDADEQHRIETSYSLLASTLSIVPPTLVCKPWESVVLKTYRINVLNNVNWPEPPPSGWAHPENCHITIRDIVRTNVVVKYLDGVELVAALIKTTAESLGLDDPDISFEARDEGYYAVHATVWVPMSFPGKRWESVTESIPVEIQISTQVQDVIRALTHKYYEHRRTQVLDPDEKWQWNYRSDQIVPNYLGHMRHYAEGVLMAIRDKQEER